MPLPTPAIESHPMRSQIIDAIIAGKSCRDISATLDPPLGHSAIARYKARVVLPALNSKLRSNTFTDIHPQVKEQIQQAKVETRQALDADYITSRINAKLKRLDGAIAKTLTAKDYDAYSKLETNDSKAIELLAKATMHPGFVATASQPTEVTVNTIVVMPNPDLCNGSVSGVSTSVTTRPSQARDIDISPA